MSLTVLVPENDVVPSPADEPRTRPWIPPLDAEGLRSVLERLRNWNPFDVEKVFDDLDTAIGDQTPPAAVTDILVDRLRDHLKQLSAIAVADQQYPPTAEMLQLVARGVPLRVGRAPADHRQAVGLARRLAFVTSDLVDELIESRYIKEAE